MSEIILEKRYPHSRTEDITDAFMRGYVKGKADRPQGVWFKDDEGTFICSACGSGYKDQPTLMGKPMFKWCPICGARMVKEANK